MWHNIFSTLFIKVGKEHLMLLKKDQEYYGKIIFVGVVAPRISSFCILKYLLKMKRKFSRVNGTVKKEDSYPQLIIMMTKALALTLRFSIQI